MNKRNNIATLVMNSWVLHLLFWSFSFYILLRLFAGSSQVEQIDWIYTSIFISTLIATSIVNLYVSMPFLLQQGSYANYVISLIVLLLSGSLVNYLLFDRWIDTILPGYYFISYYNYWDILKFFIVFVAATSLLKLSKDWFYLNKAQQQLQELEKAKVEAELSALKNQVNPHFLFNSLNVLYSLVRKNAKEAPEAIIKLSDILRYVLYESNTEYVPLHKEIKLVKNYIDLQKYRKGAKVNFHLKVKDEEVQIVPMILLPLIENAYKHSQMTKEKVFNIDIDLNCNSQQLELIIKNSINPDAQKAMEKHSGIGQKNITQRLDHYYPEKYSLDIREENEQYIVNLKIDIA